MKLLLILLDGVSIEALVAVSLVYVVLPIAAIILLIWLFIKRKNKKQP
ncbi:MAG: hypothetical protein WDM90_01845 [Ferruginibacter sp.]